jgi:hypothetical protein
VNSFLRSNVARLTACLLTLIPLSLGYDKRPTRPRASDVPFFEQFPLKTLQEPQRKVIYGQSPLAYNHIPSITRAPDGRLFLCWIAEIGFARGGRIVGAPGLRGGGG